MSKYSDSLKTAKRKDLEFFFGNIHPTSGKYFQFPKIISNDEIILMTNNITFIKDTPVLIVGAKKGIYLKDWQLRKVASYTYGINCYAVKLNRKYFKPYEFKFEFNDYEESEEMDFDYLLEICKEQDEENIPIREGWCK